MAPCSFSTIFDLFWFQVIKINETINEFTLALNKEELDAILTDSKVKDLPVCVVSVAG
jgi:hypothetical protein